MKDGTGFVWRSLRISFWTMIAIYVISIILAFSSYISNGIFLALSALFLVLLISTFVLSIMHLVRYKKKAFAIVALVISSMFILLNIFAFLLGFLISYAGTA